MTRPVDAGLEVALLLTTVSETDENTRERLAAIGEIAAEIAHELRNVLQIISSNAWLARQDPAGSPAALEKIERNARLAFTIVDDLMSLARGEPTHATPIQVAELIARARTEIDPDAATWCDNLTPEDVTVRGHAGLFPRVLHALYENAVHACAPRPPRIETRAFRQDGRIVIDVSDDGPGVPADIAPRIFDPLVTGRSGGTGLGLAMAKRIVAAHGGTVRLLEGTTGGATFRIELPGGG